MKLYHYTKVDIRKNDNFLLSLHAQGKLTKEEINNSYKESKRVYEISSYIDSISFFFSPIPSKFLGNLYNGLNHRTWFKGNELFECIVDTDDLNKDIMFSVEESPNKIKFADSLDWVTNHEKTLLYYYKEWSSEKQKIGEMGRGISKLEKQINLYNHGLEKYYQEASLREDWKDGLKTYAGNVPHVMIYPNDGKIKCLNINKVIIGSDKRIPINDEIKLLSMKL